MKTILKKAGLFAAAMGVASIASAGNITVKGSDTLVILAQKWAEVYMGKNPSTKIQVTGGGSGVGMAALQNKTTDLANSSRKIRGAEISECIKAFGRRPTEYKVALDGLSVYVHESNPITELTVDQLGQIFTGRIKNWSQVGGPNAPITIYSRENSSGTYEFFKEHVLKGADFASSAQTMPGTAAVLQSVAKGQEWHRATVARPTARGPSISRSRRTKVRRRSSRARKPWSMERIRSGAICMCM
jgi:phosphate transport system substrate-binding protein